MLQILEDNKTPYDPEQPDAGNLNWVTHYAFLGTGLARIRFWPSSARLRAARWIPGE
jgi:hypothetical protein